MADKRRATKAQRPTYIRKGHVVRRMSDLPIWDWLRLIEKVPAPKAKLLQSASQAELR